MYWRYFYFIDDTLIPLKEGEEYVLPKDGVYSEMLKMLDSNRFSGDLGVAKRITFKLPQNTKKDEIENMKSESPEITKPNLRIIKTAAPFGESVMGSYTLDLS